MWSKQSFCGFYHSVSLVLSFLFCYKRDHVKLFLKFLCMGQIQSTYLWILNLDKKPQKNPNVFVACWLWNSRYSLDFIKFNKRLHLKFLYAKDCSIIVLTAITVINNTVEKVGKSRFVTDFKAKIEMFYVFFQINSKYCKTIANYLL